MLEHRVRHRLKQEASVLPLRISQVVEKTQEWGTWLWESLAIAGVGSIKQRRLQTANLHIHPSSESPLPPFLYSHNHPCPGFSQPPCHTGNPPLPLLIAGRSLNAASAPTFLLSSSKLFTLPSPTLISWKCKSAKTCSFHSLVRQFPRSWHSPQLATSANQWSRDDSQGSSMDGCLPLIFQSFYLPVHKEGKVVTLISKGFCGGSGGRFLWDSE